MWYCLSFIFLIEAINCEELTSTKNKSIEFNQNNTIFNLQRITQPSAQTQQIERSITNPPPTNSSVKSEKGKSEFRPSPQLETYYEFNKFPVPPALPEAKHFSAYNLGESPIQWNTNSFTTEQSWATRIKFPTTSTTMAPTSKERPYQFYNPDNDSNGKSYNVPSNSDVYLQQPLDKIPTVEDWYKFINYQKKKEIIQKNQFDFTAPVQKPVYGMNTGEAHKTSGFDFGAVEKTPSHGVQGYPWKKIIKFLTAFIPIGLLISALTPTVITVQSVNGTQIRSRAVDPTYSANRKLVTSLNYFNSIGCDDRILCELVLSASATQNAEHHVENLLNTFTKEGKAVEKAEEMRKILEAVKKQDCRPIKCKGMKEKT